VGGVLLGRLGLARTFVKPETTKSLEGRHRVKSKTENHRTFLFIDNYEQQAFKSCLLSS
jgi:aspartyl/asparaginyl beta-hydroxylase (cupin superfamily)